jgi:hypothetical protein
MEIRVINAIVEKWQSYNKVLTPWNLLEKRRLELGRSMLLRKADIDQHLINSLRNEKNEDVLAFAKDTIISVVQMVDATDRNLICNLFRSLYEELKFVKDCRYKDLTAVKMSSTSADLEKDLQQANERADALAAELKTHIKYIERMKKRNWWQRLWDEDVDMFAALNSECKCPNRQK